MSNLSPGTHHLIAGGTLLVYHVAGAGPVMVAHSGGPGVEYSYLRSARLEEHFTMVYLEPAGTGGSGPLPDGATYVDTYVDFVHALVEHLDVDRVHILGHSHGGFVAQRFALRYPDRTAGLALYSTAPTTAPEFWAVAEANQKAYPRRHPDVPEAAAVLDFIDGFDTVETDEDKTRHLAAALPIYFADFWGRRAEFAPVQESIRAWVVTLSGRTFDYRPDLPSITARTVVLTGRHDFICPPVWSEALHAGIPGSRLVIMERSGHFAQIEEPEAFLEAVTWLLRS
ncbi:proline iminopeptidase [Catenuloplanes nepalensis]|uniref:Proline iminopeptidase n=1 Tax=Catenuloplanes nepalensis TaxID=587533 RepID=A0ABT9MQI2_9ACTN|nr:alpha/beta hydrolase [Catenuloplanes nepalensis]MDP9793677.1 proline iminopeptidase [Catenuloplanes nepalensis]